MDNMFIRLLVGFIALYFVIPTFLYTCTKMTMRAIYEVRKNYVDSFLNNNGGKNGKEKE